MLEEPQEARRPSSRRRRFSDASSVDVHRGWFELADLTYEEEMPTTVRYQIWGPFRGLAWLGAVIAWIAAAAIGAALAIFFAATVVVIALMAGALLLLAGAAVRARRTVRAAADPELIEAQHIGGHSWVAYGWDGRR
jgi:hypothetical protein